MFWWLARCTRHGRLRIGGARRRSRAHERVGHHESYGPAGRARWGVSRQGRAASRVDPGHPSENDAHRSTRWLVLCWIRTPHPCTVELTHYLPAHRILFDHPAELAVVDGTTVTRCAEQ